MVGVTGQMSRVENHLAETVLAAAPGSRGGAGGTAWHARSPPWGIGPSTSLLVRV
ncbi:MAG: hypothetical protein JRN35_07270 [Nitrososphaerota archaeon]|nr:hypothetical protein [Nitrososphaerota archaeon]